MTHPDSELLSGYLDGDLGPLETRDIQDHLASCPSCMALFRQLEEVRARARALPDRLPSRDLWPEIRESLGDQEYRETDVIQLYPWRATGGQGRRTRGVTISYLQVAAAAVALALFSGATGAFVTRTVLPEAGVDNSGQDPWVEMVSSASSEAGSSALEVLELEELLARHRDELDPVTVRLLEDNMAVIDQAIREAVRALEVDPGNRFLKGHLEDAVRSKATYLRQAAAFIGPRS